MYQLVTLFCPILPFLREILLYLSERTNWNKNEIYKNKDIKIDFEGIDICPEE